MGEEEEDRGTAQYRSRNPRARGAEAVPDRVPRHSFESKREARICVRHQIVPDMTWEGDAEQGSLASIVQYAHS